MGEGATGHDHADHDRAAGVAIDAKAETKPGQIGLEQEPSDLAAQACEMGLPV